MIERNLAEQILFFLIGEGADTLRILSGYATPNMASWLIKNLQEKKLGPIKIQLVIGMTVYNGMSVDVHKGFVELHKNHYPWQSQFSCGYVYEQPPVHSNLYVWSREDEPIKAFTGSMEFLQNSFVSGRLELAEECDVKRASDYFDAVEAKSIYCDNSEVEEYVVIKKQHPFLDEEGETQIQLSGEGVTHVTLSLLSRTGEVGMKSGLNWGHRNNRNRNEAYIPLLSKMANSGFFPLKKQHFMARTDDGCNLILRVEQANNKAITTPMSNALLGEYFRRRLGLANGAFVSLSDLKNYGRTDVTFYKIDDETFYMDFSVNEDV